MYNSTKYNQSQNEKEEQKGHPKEIVSQPNNLINCTKEEFHGLLYNWFTENQDIKEYVTNSHGVMANLILAHIQAELERNLGLKIDKMAKESVEKYKMEAYMEINRKFIEEDAQMSSKINKEFQESQKQIRENEIKNTEKLEKETKEAIQKMERKYTQLELDRFQKELELEDKLEARVERIMKSTILEKCLLMDSMQKSINDLQTDLASCLLKMDNMNGFEMKVEKELDSVKSKQKASHEKAVVHEDKINKILTVIGSTENRITNLSLVRREDRDARKI